MDLVWPEAIQCPLRIYQDSVRGVPGCIVRLLRRWVFAAQAFLHKTSWHKGRKLPERWVNVLFQVLPQAFLHLAGCNGHGAVWPQESRTELLNHNL